MECEVTILAHQSQNNSMKQESLLPNPFSQALRARKFSAVFGTLQTPRGLSIDGDVKEHRAHHGWSQRLWGGGIYKAKTFILCTCLTLTVDDFLNFVSSNPAGFHLVLLLAVDTVQAQ